MAIVKLKIRPAPDEGFLVILTAKNLEVETEGFLPSLPPELTSSYEGWQSAYRQIDDVRSCITGLRLTPKKVINYSPGEYIVGVKEHLNQWLNVGDSRWRPIRDGLIAIAKELHGLNEEINFIIDVKDINLRRLPWQEWSLFQKYYSQAEIALSAPKNSNTQSGKLDTKRTNDRILVVVGRSDGINTQEDLNIIQELEKYGVEIVYLLQPSREELQETLRDEKGYNIFVFTGHSGSQEDGQIGWIELNAQDSLSIEDFKKALKKAIKRGLQLAIFNSCDGLGLANQLAELQLPQIIVMREPVPDRVAVEFLRYFFQELTQNNSLFTSVHEARNRLEHFESQYPGAMWLPTICIEPNTKPFSFQPPAPPPTPEITPERVINQESKNPPIQKQKNIKPWLLTGLVSLCVGGVVVWLCIPPSPPSGKFRYGGSTSWAPIRSKVDQKIKEKWPEFQLSYYQRPGTSGGSVPGIEMLLDGDISFAQSSRIVDDNESKSANVKNFKLKPVRIAIDAIAIVIHPSLNISSLSVEQLKGIYTGQITNWQQVGGPDLIITPYTRSQEGGTTKVFQKYVLQDDNFGANIKEISDTTSTLQQVGKNPNNGGIYYASAAEVINQCSVKTIRIKVAGGKEIAVDTPGVQPGEKCPWQHNKLNFTAVKNNEYPMTRYLYVIIKEDGQVDEKVGEFYANYLLSNEGQNLIEQAGFVRVR
ncbi:MAG: substrate-binding domain-containing protein [Gloeotrichia echinulata GP01]